MVSAVESIFVYSRTEKKILVYKYELAKEYIEQIKNLEYKKDPEYLDKIDKQRNDDSYYFKAMRDLFGEKNFKKIWKED